LGSNFRHNEYWTNLRNKILVGEHINDAAECYRNEADGSTSLRLRYLKDPLPTTPDVLPLTYIEANFSNLCNLACVHCSPFLSSTWGAQDYKFGRLKHQKILIEHNADFEGLDLSQVTELKIIGGEPFMEQKRFVGLMKKLDLSKVTLRISTNGTVLPKDDLKELMDQCNRVFVSVSVDGIYSVNDWYRWPSKFSNVESVMSQFEKWWVDNPNYNLFVKHTINLYNVWTLDKLIMYMNQNRSGWKLYFGWVESVEWQSISNMPRLVKQVLADKLTYWDKSIKGNWDQQNASPFISTKNRLQSNSQSTWKKFIEKTKQLEQERNLNAFDMIPELALIINNHQDD